MKKPSTPATPEIKKVEKVASPKPLVVDWTEEGDKTPFPGLSTILTETYTLFILLIIM